MPSSFTPSLRLTLPVTGENTGTWGDLVNSGITSLVDSSVAGYAAITMTDANYTLTSVNGAADEARKMMLNMSGTLTAARNVICPTASKLYFIKNATTGGFAITLKTSTGSGISIPNGRSAVLMCNGTDVVEAVDYSANINTANISYTGTLTGSTGIVNLGSGQFYKDGSGNVGINTATPGSTLDVKGTLRLSGATSGYVGFSPAAAAGTTTYTLPTADGTAGQVLQTNGSAVLSWASAAGGVTSVTATAPVVSSGGATPVISMAAATASVNGYMTSTYASKLDGITAGAAPGAVNFGYLNIPQNSKSAAYTLVLADSGKHILHPSADTTARTFTIPANGTVAFPIGTAITFVNQNGAGNITIAITTDTMRLAGAGTTGSRTLTANGTATALKITATEWLISGVNLT
jgi:hypothetical protein